MYSTLSRRAAKVLILAWAALVLRRYYPFETLFSYHPLSLVLFDVVLVFSVDLSIAAKEIRGQKNDALRDEYLSRHKYGMLCSMFLSLAGIAVIVSNKVKSGKGFLFLSGRLPSTHGYSGILWVFCMFLTGFFGWVAQKKEDLPSLAIHIVGILGGSSFSSAHALVKIRHRFLGKIAIACAFIATGLGLVNHSLYTETSILAIVYALLVL